MGRQKGVLASEEKTLFSKSLETAALYVSWQRGNEVISSREKRGKAHIVRIRGKHEGNKEKIFGGLGIGKRF